MRTLVSIQGTELNDDGTAASGEVCAKATAVIVNDGVEYPITPVCGLLDPEGRVISQSWLALELYATDDTDTEPQDTAYQFTLRLDGQDVREFAAAVPAASTATDDAATVVDASAVVTLGQILVAQSMVGQTITGSAIPGSTTVESIDAATNQLTMSAVATAAGTSVTVGGAVLLTELEASAL